MEYDCLPIVLYKTTQPVLSKIVLTERFTLRPLCSQILRLSDITLHFSTEISGIYTTHTSD
jgi:hypothetical protein